MKFEFDHVPIAKMRAGRNGRHSFNFQSKECKHIKGEMQDTIDQTLKGNEHDIIELGTIVKASYLKATFIFELPPPASQSDSNKNLMRWNILEPDKKPDLDNLEKFYLDCANETIFHDDKMVIACTKQKKYAMYDKPKVTMTIEKKGENASLLAKNVLSIFGPGKVRELMKSCYALSKLPMSELEEHPNDEVKDRCLEHISTTLLQFADMWASDLNKVKNKCKTDTRFGDGKPYC